MTDVNEISGRLRQLLDERVSLETRLQAEKGEISSRASTEYDRSYNKLQKSLAQLFRDARDESQRVTIMLELIRILENKLVYLQNFVVDPTSDNRTLASLVTQFIDEDLSDIDWLAAANYVVRFLAAGMRAPAGASGHRKPAAKRRKRVS